jgi:hypothetical protein
LARTPSACVLTAGDGHYPDADRHRRQPGAISAGDRHRPSAAHAGPERQLQKRFATDTALGEVVITPDANTLSNFTVLNAYLVNFNELPFTGMDAGYVVTISGYILANDNMWV